jgi:hypothetical protein
LYNLIIDNVSDFHSSAVEDSSLLRCYTVFLGLLELLGIAQYNDSSKTLGTVYPTT